MASEELDKQIAAEAKEIQEAPKMPLQQPRTTGMSGRCGWCGKFSDDLVLVEVFHGVERYKGTECCGGRHV